MALKKSGSSDVSFPEQKDWRNRRWPFIYDVVGVVKVVSTLFALDDLQ